MNRKKILVALDGSSQSKEAARYITKIFPTAKLEVVLFMVFNKMPEAYWDIAKNNNDFIESISPFMGALYERERAAEEFMEQTRQLFLNAGVAPEAVEVNIHNKQLGIESDILSEAERGNYRGVVLGRTGRSKVKDFVLGSVAHKIVQQIGDVPVWVVGGSPEPGRILVALDTSTAALRVVDYVGELFSGCDFDITLFHAARKLDTYRDETEKQIDPAYEESWLKVIEEKIGSIFVESIDRLVKSGIDRNRITIKVRPKAESRAAAILNEAQTGHYGTIFAGRRGLSQENKLMIGRVTYKLVQNASNVALCIVD